MGKQYREQRKILKQQAARLGVREDEFGELKVKTTKAEHRRRLVQQAQFWHNLLLANEVAILDNIAHLVLLDIDREILAEVERSIEDD